MCKGDCAATFALSESIFKQFGVHLLGQRVGVSERNVRKVRRALGSDLVQNLAHLRTLVFTPLPDGASASNVCILLLDLGCPTFRDEGSEVALERAKRNQVAVREESREKAMDFASLAGSAHVHEDHGSWTLGGGVVLGDGRDMSSECSLLLPCLQLRGIEALPRVESTQGSVCTHGGVGRMLSTRVRGESPEIGRA